MRLRTQGLVPCRKLSFLSLLELLEYCWILGRPESQFPFHSSLEVVQLPDAGEAQPFKVAMRHVSEQMEPEPEAVTLPVLSGHWSGTLPLGHITHLP